MEKFVELYQALERPTDSVVRIESLISYFENVVDQDKIWALALLINRKPKRLVSLKQLKIWAEESSQLPSWLLEESYKAIGDTTETISTLISESESSTKTLTEWVNSIKTHQSNSLIQIKSFVLSSWAQLTPDERFVFNKLTTGGLKVKVSEKLVVTALSEFIKVEESKIALQLSSDWKPDETSYQQLFLNVKWNEVFSIPFQFPEIRIIKDANEVTFDPGIWHAEWQYEGKKAQVVKYNDRLDIWIENDGLLMNAMPEFESLKNINKNDFVAEGVLVIFKDGKVRPIQELNKRLKIAKASKKILAEYPIAFIASDLLDYGGDSIVDKPLEFRRNRLNRLLNKLSGHSDVIFMTDTLNWKTEDELNLLRQTSRSMSAVGVLLKNKSDQSFSSNGKRSDILWKVDSLKINAVLLYAQRGQARNSNQYIEFTFAVRQKDNTLVPVTKTANNLKEEDNDQIERFIKKNTLEKFGPVRSILPELIFEISMTNVIESKRHKSGVILQDAIPISWKEELSIDDIATIEQVRSFIQG